MDHNWGDYPESEVILLPKSNSQSGKIGMKTLGIGGGIGIGVITGAPLLSKLGGGVSQDDYQKAVLKRIGSGDTKGALQLLNNIQDERSKENLRWLIYSSTENK